MIFVDMYVGYKSSYSILEWLNKTFSILENFTSFNETYKIMTFELQYFPDILTNEILL